MNGKEFMDFVKLSKTSKDDLVCDPTTTKEDIIAKEVIEGLEQEGILARDDYSAEITLNKRAERIAERDRLVDACSKMIEHYTQRIEEIKAEYKPSIDFYEAQLYAYANIVPMKETATQKSYKLPSGTLKITKAKQELTPDREALVTFMEQGGGHEWVKVKKDIDWAGLKKTITIVDGKAVWEQTGEILDCVSVTEKPESFSIS